MIASELPIKRISKNKILVLIKYLFKSQNKSIDYIGIWGHEQLLRGRKGVRESGIKFSLFQRSCCDVKDAKYCMKECCSLPKLCIFLNRESFVNR